MKNEFALAFNEVLEDKGLPKDVVLEALQAAMVSAYRRSVNASSAQHVEALIDSDTGKVRIFAEKEVVDGVQDDRTEVLLKVAQGVDPDADTEYAYVPILRYKRLLRDDSYVGGIYTARMLGDHLNVAGGADGVMRLSESSTFGYHGLLSYTRENSETDDVSGHALGISYSSATRNVDYSLLG